MKPRTLTEEDFAKRRAAMAERQLRARGIADERVLDTMARIPRHRFVPASALAEAYEDHPLAIGEGQTISQPYIVALMTEALQLEGPERVLEVGTGSGYQTAILAALCREVTTIEVSPRLADRAAERLRTLGYSQVRFLIGDGTGGAAQHGPYDRILATGSLPSVPTAMLAQLTPAGMLVAPVGDRWEQDLIRLRRTPHGDCVDHLGGCRFVPLLGEHGWKA